MVYSGVDGGARCCLRCSMRRGSTLKGDMMGSGLSPYVIASPFSPSF